MLSLRRSLAVFALLVLAGSAAAQLQVSLDPRSTYLHTNQDNSVDAVPLDLGVLGIFPGDHLRMVQRGDFDNGPGGDTFTSLICVFSATSTLLAKAERFRVPDALEAGFDFNSAKTYYGSQETDIPEDFAVSYGEQREVTVTVPAGAAYLFLGPHDSLFYDNSDPDGDYGVTLWVIPPGRFVDLGHGLAGGKGVPQLTGTGTLIAADPVAITLSNARPSSLSFLILGFSRWDVPFNGGLLVPALDLYFALPTDALGGFQLSTLFSPGVPADIHFFLQTWIVDPAAVKGMSASNALEVITP